MAPVAAAISSKSSAATKSASLRPAPHSTTSPGAAMNPSSDIALFTTTLPSPVFVSLICASPQECIRHQPTTVRAGIAHGARRRAGLESAVGGGHLAGCGVGLLVGSCGGLDAVVVVAAVVSVAED